MFSKKLLLILGSILLSNNVLASNDRAKEEVLQKLDKITSYYLEKVANEEKEEARLDLIIVELEKDLKELQVASEEIEVRKNLIKELYVDLVDTKNLYLLEMDEDGNVKEEIAKAALTVKESLGEGTKIVKIKLANGKFLPLVKYKVKKNDTLKKITLNTYPSGYEPTWLEISKRIDTLVKINKNIIKMNYIYPDQIIYVPLFKDNPNKNVVKESILKKKQKELNKELNK